MSPPGTPRSRRPGAVGRSLRRLVGRLVGRGLAPRAHFVYGPAYRLELPGVAADPQRGERILTFLAAAGLAGGRRVHAPEPASYHQLRRVHDDGYLEALGRPGALVPILGLDLPDPLPDRVLESQRAMTGGTVLATRLALAGRTAAVNLGGGLHHAFAARGERFCLFNDVAVALAQARAEGFAGPVLVVDLDLHDGDGTRSLLAGDPAVATFSIHNRTTPGAASESPPGPRHVAVELGGEVEDGAYLAALRERLPPLLAAVRPELAFYLAGSDPALDDEIGDWKITSAGMLARDRFVFECLLGGERRVPTVVLLAGGYGQRAWRYGARSLAWLLTGRAVEPPSTEELTLARYRAVAQRLAPHELTGDAPGRDETAKADDWGLTAEDFAAAGGMRARSRFLGYYSPQGLELTLERAGLLDHIRQLGFDPRLEVDLDNPGGETLRLYGDRRQSELLIELRARIDRGAVPGLTLLRAEWLLLQNPRAAFTAERPPLPGQRHPGLGLLGDVMALLVIACDRLHLDGVVFVPAHYHVAVQGRRLLRFASPAHEGRFRAVSAALAGLPLAAASAAVEAGRLRDAETGRPLRWEPMPMLIPVSERARAATGGEEYDRLAAGGAEAHRFELAG